MNGDTDILNLVAKKLFESKVRSLAQGKSSEPLHLDDEELERLAAKILLLPDDWQEALLLRYGCGFDSALIDDMLETENSAGDIIYAKDMLEDVVEIENISDESMEAACRIALRKWRGQIKEVLQSECPISESKDFDKKMRRLLRKETNVLYVKFGRYAKRAAIVLLAGLITATITVFSVEALRDKFFDWWFSVFPSHTRVEFTNVEQIYGADTYDKLKQYNLPTYIPQGFILIKTVEAKNNHRLVFQNEFDGWIILDIQILHEGSHVNLNTENAESELISINGSEGLYTYKDGDSITAWSNANAFFMLSCNLTKDEVLKIANSTKI
ncbi:MAG TPA: hypothetical protein DEQ02_07235 [Ruminococcaceae bacterium]|nr:hypothetical protein [Oscillospiraceae bacterium]